MLQVPLPCELSIFPIQPLYNQPSDTAVYHQNKRKSVYIKSIDQSILCEPHELMYTSYVILVPTSCL